MSSCSLPNDTIEGMECLCADVNFQTTLSTCVSSSCTVVEYLQSTNASRAACGIPVRDNTPVMIAMTASFGTLAMVMVIMRLVNRGFSRDRKLGWDDLLIGLSGVSKSALWTIHQLISSKAVLSLSERACVYRSVTPPPHMFSPSLTSLAAGYLGFGRDIWNIPPDNITASLKVSSDFISCCVVI